MSARDRSNARRRAKEAGYRAYQSGKPVENNPYKKSDWGNGIPWEMGWLDAQREQENSDE